MNISSPAFEFNHNIPIRYTGDGENIRPPLKFWTVPEQAKTLAIIMDDPDAPSGTFTHWIVWNIPADSLFIPEGSLPEGAIEGKNDAGTIGYIGPKPPSGIHRYFFKLYAVDEVLTLAEGANRQDLEAALKNHVWAEEMLVGLYGR